MVAIAGDDAVSCSPAAPDRGPDRDRFLADCRGGRNRRSGRGRGAGRALLEAADEQHLLEMAASASLALKRCRSRTPAEAAELKFSPGLPAFAVFADFAGALGLGGTELAAFVPRRSRHRARFGRRMRLAYRRLCAALVMPYAPLCQRVRKRPTASRLRGRLSCSSTYSSRDARC